jgi:vancomycin resistance protein YoaR
VTAATPTRVPRRRRWLVVGGLGAIVVVCYVIGWFLTSDRIATGTRVAGVDIGGLSADEAERKLGERLSDRAAAPMVLTTPETSVELDPVSVGLEIDIEATVSEAGGGHAWNPIEMVERLVAADHDVDPTVDVDDERLAAWAADLADQVNTEAAEPVVTFAKSGEARVVEPVTGFAVDEQRTSARVVSSYLATADPIAVIGEDVVPEVDDAELATALVDLAAPATSGPVALRLPGRTVQLRVADFAPALTLEVTDGELAPVVDAERLDGRLAGRIGKFGEEPVDATVKIRAGRPVVVPAKPGITVDAADVAEALPAALTATGSARNVEVGQSVARPEFTTRDATQLGIKEVVSDFVTYFPYAEYRNTNQGRAAELINGTILEPDELFSFNGTVGERTEENGFVVGFIIQNGVFAEDLGGGVSQVVTTTYNAAFFAGLEDVEHKPHSFYIDRYPMGREATVAWPSVDLKFRNTTPHGVLIEAWVVPSTPTTQGEMHVRMWSTKYWDIEAKLSGQYNFTSPDTRYDPTDRCVATTGYGGFSVDVTRVFRLAGSSKIEDTETRHVTYTPADTVICSAPPG